MAQARSWFLLLALVTVPLLAGCTDRDDDATTTTPLATTTPSPTLSTTPRGATGVPPPLPVGAPDDEYDLAAGNASPLSSVIGVALRSAVAATSAPGFRIGNVTSSAGPIDALRAIAGNESQLALVEADALAEAYHGKGRFDAGALPNVRAVGSLLSMPIQVVTLERANISNVTALAGTTVAIGLEGSLSARHALALFAAANISVDEQYFDLPLALTMLKDGDIDALVFVGEAPHGAIRSLASSAPLRLLPIAGATRAALLAGEHAYVAAPLPGGTYQGQDGPVETLAIRLVLAARADLPADDVESLLRILYDGTAVQRAHPQAEAIRLADARLGIADVPLHEGASHYYASRLPPTPAP